MNDCKMFQFILIVAWYLKLVNCYPAISSEPYCDQVIGKNDRCVADRTQLEPRYSSVSCELKEWTPESCEINRNHSLRITLDRLTSIEEVFLQEPVLMGKFTNVTLWTGNIAHECKRSGHETLFSNQPFAKFSCVNAKHPQNVIKLIANAIQINSTVHRIVGLTTKGSLNWLILKHGTKGDKSHDSTYMAEKKRELQQHGEQSLKCPPIDAYPGMPMNYADTKLIVDGTINDLLLQKPCREGYALEGNLNDIKQCKNGIWQGSRFPNCQLILPKTPPEVDHARWSYIHYDVLTEINYTCDDSYYVKGTGQASYSTENYEWINVPTCIRRDTLDGVQYYWLIAFGFIGALGFICILIVAVALIIRKLRLRKVKKAPAVYEELRHSRRIRATLSRLRTFRNIKVDPEAQAQSTKRHFRI